MFFSFCKWAQYFKAIDFYPWFQVLHILFYFGSTGGGSFTRAVLAALRCSICSSLRLIWAYSHTVLLYNMAQALAAINADWQPRAWAVNKETEQQVCSSPGKVCQLALDAGVDGVQVKEASNQRDSNMGSGSSSATTTVNRWVKHVTWEKGVHLQWEVQAFVAVQKNSICVLLFL